MVGVSEGIEGGEETHKTEYHFEAILKKKKQGLKLERKEKKSVKKVENEPLYLKGKSILCC